MSWSSQLHPQLAPYAQYLVAHMPGAQVTSVYRSPTDQLRLWHNRHNNPYPVAPPGRSLHEYRLAFDVVAPREVLHWAGAVWRSWGGTWSPSDEIHFQA